MSTAVTIIGNITRDPEIHFSESGKSVVSFSIAVNKNRKGENGEWEQAEPEFYDCVTFNAQAENFANTFSKGQRVIAIGRLQNRSWKDKETGQDRRKVELVIDEIGASIRWATAVITKTERAEGGNQSYSKPTAQRQSAPSGWDEYGSEPF